MKKAAVINLGCPKNQVDSEIISGILTSRYTLTSDPAEANLIIVNTCGFIEEAKTESIETILEMAAYKKKGQCEKIVAAGCLAQRYGKELLEEIEELDGVFGDGDLGTLLPMLERTGQEKLYTYSKDQNYLCSHEMPRVLFSPSYYAYLKIAEGCNNCCSYCAIPRIKGSYRSRSISSVTEEAKKLAQAGVKELILVAQDTTRYGTDQGGEAKLIPLLQALCRIEGIEWIRLLYCYPEAFSPELIDYMAGEPKICRYVDLPLQHGDNEILRKMNRRNTAEEALDLIRRLRKNIPGIFIRSTFITGFPGESEENFRKLLDFVKEAKLDRVGVFAYSREEGTPAAKMKEQIPARIKERRKQELLNLQAEIAAAVQQERVGSTLRVILEEELAPLEWQGRTEGDAPDIDGQIFLKVSKGHLPGDIIEARIIGADCFDFRGEGLS